MLIFIGRESYLDDFRGHLKAAGETGFIVRYRGQAGIGKSTLLKRFAEICDEQDHPYCSLNLDGVGFSSGQQFLFEIARSARNFPDARALAAQHQSSGSNLQKNLKYHEETINTVMGALEKVDPTGGIAANLIHTVIDFGQGVLNRKTAEKKAKELANAAFQNSELFLLNVLAKVGEKHPVCFLDGYEHLFQYNHKLTSRIEYTLDGRQVREFNQSEIVLAKWVKDLVQFLERHGWLIITAGRSYATEQDENNSELLGSG